MFPGLVGQGIDILLQGGQLLFILAVLTRAAQIHRVQGVERGGIVPLRPAAPLGANLCGHNRRILRQGFAGGHGAGERGGQGAGDGHITKIGVKSIDECPGRIGPVGNGYGFGRRADQGVVIFLTLLVIRREAAVALVLQALFQTFLVGFLPDMQPEFDDQGSRCCQCAFQPGPALHPPVEIVLVQAAATELPDKFAVPAPEKHGHFTLAG